MVSRKQYAARMLSGAALAAAAAGFFASGVISTAVAADEAKVQCVGVNGCKGKSDCKTAMSECKGQNACKGKGFVEMSEKTCMEKGGKVKKG